MFDRKFIGHKFDPFPVEVERGAVRLFAKAIGETDPIYFDEAAARAAGYPAIATPLTFVASLVALSPQYFPTAALLGFSEENVLHVGQEYDFFSEICVGDRLTLQEQIVDLYDKRDGALNFVVTAIELRRGTGELAAISRETLLVSGG